MSRPVRVKKYHAKKCTDPTKVRHTSEAAAIAAAFSQSNAFAASMTVFACVDHWHVAHLNNTTKRRRARLASQPTSEGGTR